MPPPPPPPPHPPLPTVTPTAKQRPPMRDSSLHPSFGGSYYNDSGLHSDVSRLDSSYNRPRRSVQRKTIDTIESVQSTQICPSSPMSDVMSDTSSQQESKSHEEILATYAVDWLVNHKHIPWKISLELIFHLMLWRSPSLIAAGRKRLLSCIEQLTEEILEKNRLKKEQLLPPSEASSDMATWGYCVHLLALLPYFEVPPGTIFNVPVYRRNSWRIFSMSTGRAALNQYASPSYLYTLEPLAEPLERFEEVQRQAKGPSTKMPAFLLFMGTAPPTTLGSLISLWSDFVPGTMVGEVLYRIGKKTIDQTIHSLSSRGYGPIFACGQSLGGALAQQAVANHPHRLRGIAINAPMCSYATKKRMLRSLNPKSVEGTPKERIVRFNHKEDLICQVGTTLLPHTKSYTYSYSCEEHLKEQQQAKRSLMHSLRQRSRQLVGAHAKVFAAHLGAKIEPVKQKERPSLIMNSLHMIGSLLFFTPLTLLLAVECLYHELCKRLFGNKEKL